MKTRVRRLEEDARSDQEIEDAKRWHLATNLYLFGRYFPDCDLSEVYDFVQSIIYGPYPTLELPLLSEQSARWIAREARLDHLGLEMLAITIAKAWICRSCALRELEELREASKGERHCGKCQKWLPVEAFSPQSRWCRKCKFLADRWRRRMGRKSGAGRQSDPAPKEPPY